MAKQGYFSPIDIPAIWRQRFVKRIRRKQRKLLRIPKRFYSIIWQGIKDKTSQIKDNKPLIKKGKKKSKLKKYLLSFALLIVVISAIPFYIYILKDLPSPRNLSGNTYPVSTEIYDRHGTLLYEIYADENRTPIKLDQIPKDVINATIAIEDKDFYSHKGLAVTGILRAAYKTVFQKVIIATFIPKIGANLFIQIEGEKYIPTEIKFNALSNIFPYVCVRIQ